MIGIGLIVIIVLIVGVVVFSVRVSSKGRKIATRSSESATVGHVGSDRAADLERWVAAELIDSTQVDSIIAFETARSTSAVPMRPPRVTPTVESLAYVGGILLAVGSGMLLGRSWDRLDDWVHLLIAAVVAVAAGVVGALIGESDSVAWRLRGFLWSISAGGAGAFAGLFTFEVLDRTDAPVAFATAASICVVSGSYWSLRDQPLQHLIAFLGLVVSIGVGIAWTGTSEPAAWMGASFWVVGLMWAGLAWKQRIPPTAIGFILGVALTMVGAGIVTGSVDWLGPILGLVTATAWCAVGVFTDEVFALAPGVVGVFIFLPWTLGRLFGGSLGAPVIMMISGFALLAVVVLLLRRPRQHRSGDGAFAGGRFRLAPTQSPTGDRALTSRP